MGRMQIFQISHGLVKHHPTTKLVDMLAWDDDSTAIFMDGNSKWFKYVLIYVHMGEVVLPSTIPKATLLWYFQYYGFEIILPNAVIEYSASMGTMMEDMNVCCDQSKEDVKTLDDPNTMVAHSALLGGTVVEAMDLCKQYKEEMKMLDAEITQLQYEHSCFSMEEGCFHWCMRNGVGVVNPIVLDTFYSMIFEDVDCCFSDLNKAIMNEQLALYGLYLIQHDKDSKQLWLGKVSMKDQARVPDDKTMDLDLDLLGGLYNQCSDYGNYWSTAVGTLYTKKQVVG